MYQLNDFNNRKLLDEQLAEKVANLLSSAIKSKGKASIAVSGGSTPKGFFLALSKKDIQWSKVTITLADERWVDTGSEASNTRLVLENLLINQAKHANFFHLKQSDLFDDESISSLNMQSLDILPLDVLILGMGEDGHTASLFPCSDEIKTALNEENPLSLMKVIPRTAPHQRITFTFSSLISSHHIFIHICGDKKKQVLTQAVNEQDIYKMPIRAFLQHPTVNTHIYWAS